MKSSCRITYFVYLCPQNDAMRQLVLNKRRQILKIMELSEETIVQSGHSKKTTIEREKLRNPYIIDLLERES